MRIIYKKVAEPICHFLNSYLLSPSKFPTVATAHQKPSLSATDKGREIPVSSRLSPFLSSKPCFTTLRREEKGLFTVYFPVFPRRGGNKGKKKKMSTKSTREGLRGTTTVVQPLPTRFYGLLFAFSLFYHVLEVIKKGKRKKGRKEPTSNVLCIAHVLLSAFTLIKPTNAANNGTKAFYFLSLSTQRIPLGSSEVSRLKTGYSIWLRVSPSQQSSVVHGLVVHVGGPSLRTTPLSVQTVASQVRAEQGRGVGTVDKGGDKGGKTTHEQRNTTSLICQQ